MSIPKIIFIVPYRNRPYHREHFTRYMKYILEDINNDDYEIYFSHQNDKRPFNRGAVKNIGFLAMKDKYPNNYKDITFVFNDVDTMPAIKNLVDYNTTDGVIKHFYGFEFALGGFFSIKGKDFEKIKGFPNNWGWGFEDNCINDKINRDNTLTIDRSTFYKIGDERVLQIFDTPMRLVSKKNLHEYKSKQYDNMNHIKNLEYTIQDDEVLINNFTTYYTYKSEDFVINNMKENPNLKLPNPYLTRNSKFGMRFK